MVSTKTILNDIKEYWGIKPSNKQIKIINKINVDSLNNDIAIILTEWDEFIHLDYSRTKLFDGRYIINSNQANYVS